MGIGSDRMITAVGVAHDFDRVRQYGKHDVEGFDRTFRVARKIYDQRSVSDPDNCAGQHRHIRYLQRRPRASPQPCPELGSRLPIKWLRA